MLISSRPALIVRPSARAASSPSARVADLLEGEAVRVHHGRRPGRGRRPRGSPRPTPAAGGPPRSRAGSRPATAPCCGRTRPPAPSPPRRPAASRDHASSCRVRIVVAPSRCLQNDAKSCSPSSACDAWFIASRSSGRGQASTCRALQRVDAAGAVGDPVGVAAPQRGEPRVEPSGASTTRRTRTSCGSTPFSRRSGSRRAVASHVAVHHLAAGVDAGVGAPGADDVDRRRPAAPSPAPRSARPGRCAAPAARPTRGSRSRRRRGRSAGARSPVFHPATDTGARAARDHPGLPGPRRLPGRRVRPLPPRLRHPRRRHGQRSRRPRPRDPRERRPGGAVRVRVGAARLRRPHGVPPVAAGRAHRPPAGRRPLGALPRRRRAAAPGPGQGQVRRVPADAARRPGRGVPHRGLRAALRLGLDRGRARGRDGPASSSDRGRRAHPAIRDFLDRMGMPNRVHAPDSDVGREILALYDGEPTYPLVARRMRASVDRADHGPRRRRRHLRPARGRRRRDRRRPLHRRRRPGRPRRRRLRRVRGALDGRASRPRRSAARPAPAR